MKRILDTPGIDKLYILSLSPPLSLSFSPFDILSPSVKCLFSHTSSHHRVYTISNLTCMIFSTYRVPQASIFPPKNEYKIVHSVRSCLPRSALCAFFPRFSREHFFSPFCALFSASPPAATSLCHFVSVKRSITATKRRRGNP